MGSCFLSYFEIFPYFLRNNSFKTFPGPGPLLSQVILLGTLGSFGWWEILRHGASIHECVRGCMRVCAHVPVQEHKFPPDACGSQGTFGVHLCFPPFYNRVIVFLLSLPGFSCFWIPPPCGSSGVHTLMTFAWILEFRSGSSPLSTDLPPQTFTTYLLTSPPRKSCP